MSQKVALFVQYECLCVWLICRNWRENCRRSTQRHLVNQFRNCIDT